MNILVVDNHVLFRAGIKLLLQSCPSTKHVSECGTTSEMLELMTQSKFDLVFYDFDVSHMNGIDELIFFRKHFPSTKIVVLSSETNPLVIHRAIESGASGFITKKSSKETLFNAIDSINSGQTILPDEYTDPKYNANHYSSSRRTATAIMVCLSKRQREILHLLIQGRSNKSISEHLHISSNTVKSHLSAIFRAIGANNRTEVVYFAAKSGVPLYSNLQTLEQTYDEITKRNAA